MERIMRPALLLLVLAGACSYNRPARLDDSGGGDDGPRGDATGACAVDNGGCDTNATCTPAGSGATCACKPSYVGDGQSCRIVWQEVDSVPSLKLSEGFGAIVVGAGPKIYFGPITAAPTGSYWAAYDVIAGDVSYLGLPAATAQGDNNFHAVGLSPTAAALGTSIYLLGNYGERFDTTTFSWSDMGNGYPPSAQRGEAVAAGVNGRVWMFGGRPPYSRSVERFIPSMNVWQDLAGAPGGGLPFDVEYGATCVLGNTVYVESDFSNTAPLASLDTSADANTWRTLTTGPDLRRNPGCLIFPGKLVMNLHVYDVASNTWTTTLPAPPTAGEVYYVMANGQSYALANDAADNLKIFQLKNIE
jgi:hypothetical protein